MARTPTRPGRRDQFTLPDVILIERRNESTSRGSGHCCLGLDVNCCRRTRGRPSALSFASRWVRDLGPRDHPDVVQQLSRLRSRGGRVVRTPFRVAADVENCENVGKLVRLRSRSPLGHRCGRGVLSSTRDHPVVLYRDQAFIAGSDFAARLRLRYRSVRHRTARPGDRGLDRPIFPGSRVERRRVAPR